MTNYSTDPKLLENLNLDGFFVGWPNPPTPMTLKKILNNSQHVVLAYEDNKLIGFIYAISDAVLSAYIPLLEVLPSHQGKGIEKELTQRMLADLKSYYMIDLSCDDNVVPFYEKLGMRKNNSMFLRNYERQMGI